MIKPVKYAITVVLGGLCQFHKGTIKPKTQTRRLVNSHEFQFHKGTIKPENTTMTKLWHICFNSIKVRLNRS